MLDPADGLVVFVVDVLQDGEYADFPDNPGEQTLGVFRVIAHNHNGAQGWENTVSILFLALAKSWKAGLGLSGFSGRVLPAGYGPIRKGQAAPGR